MTPKMLIASPVDGSAENGWVTYGYHTAVRSLERSGAVILPSEIVFGDVDLPRARSIAADYAIYKTAIQWDWILWWDVDVVPTDLSVVGSMLQAAENGGYHLINAPYPRKRQPTTFSYRPLADDSLHVENDCAEVEYVPFGFTLTSRACIHAMEARYNTEVWFTNEASPSGGTVTGMFLNETIQGLHEGTPFRQYLSEDYSFCERWRRIGGKVHLYVGPGVPLGHVGNMRYLGERYELGRVQ